MNIPQERLKSSHAFQKIGRWQETKSKNSVAPELYQGQKIPDA